jgi:NAD-dependent dihydropyrimidine dehydrogenase PreA subunit
MIKVSIDNCIGCGECARVCPMEAIEIIDRKAVVNNDECVNCLSCIKVCKFNALEEMENTNLDSVVCKNCGVKCVIPNGKLGACKRFINENGSLLRNRPLQIPDNLEVDREKVAISKPLITAVGAGAAYPDYKPAPYIVEEKIDDFDVVTVVTEAPVSYSSMMVKIDTNVHIGNEGDKIRRDGKVVGTVSTEQYGHQMIIIGGVNRVKGPHGMTVVKTMTELGNKKSVKLKVDGGPSMELQVGKPPIIDGVVGTKMRVACGGGCCALFAQHLAKLVDEAIILDHHITGLLTKHPAGAEQLPYSGVTPVGRLATAGRYFFEHGNGWGGTNIENPIDAIKDIDMSIAKPGMKILVAETTFRNIALFEVSQEGKPIPLEIPAELEEFRKMAASNCEDSTVSAMYYAGVGGSARAGVTVNPIKLTQAVHKGDAVLSIAGAEAYVLPGGGITFLADVDKMVDEPFNYTASPAVLAPIEYTIIKEKYDDIGGHIKAVRKLEDVKKEGRFQLTKLKR